MTPSPYLRANQLSRLTFWWLNNLFAVGYRKQLKQSDLYEVLPEDESSRLADILERKWTSSNHIPLYRVIALMFWKQMLTPGLFLILSESARILQPYLIGEIIDYFQADTAVTELQVYLFAAGLGFTALIQVLFMPQYFFLMQKVAMQMKTAVSSVIYRKVLKISSYTLHRTSSGQVVNLLSTDIERFNDALYTLHPLWMAPFEVIVVLYLLYSRVGIPAFFPLLAVLVLIPLQYGIGYAFGQIRIKIGRLKDERTHLMNEIISGMRVIKMYCWETPFSKKIQSFRSKESSALLKALNLHGINWSIFLISQRVLAICVFIGVWLMGITLSSKAVFSCIGWLDVLSYTVVWFPLLAVEELTQLLAALRRVQLEEIKENPNIPSNHKGSQNSRSTALQMSSLCGSWTPSQTEDKTVGLNSPVDNPAFSSIEVNTAPTTFGLHNIQCSIEKGEVVAVVGKVGSGKTSLLMSILGELVPRQGSLLVSGDISYAAQQSWVFSGTLRDNVLFGKEMDQERYDAVIQSCSLDRDIAVMPNSDLTLVGERGLMLSGGQKARVTLARCVYSGGDIFLLDDPLSAVDNIVGQEIFNRCIIGFLKGKTRILVTHQMQYLETVDKIIILDEGQIVDIGDYTTLSKKHKTLLNVIQHAEDLGDKPVKWTKGPSKELFEQALDQVEEEHQAQGSVKFWVYLKYIQSCYGILAVILILVPLLTSQAAFVAGDWLLAKWAEFNRGTTDEANNQDYFIKATIISVGLFILLTFTFNAVFFSLATVSSRRLHDHMFYRVLQAKTVFFDKNPVGRILNRFARDIGQMDDFLPRIASMVITIAARIAALFLTTGIINTWLFIPLVLLTAIAFAFRIYASRTMREVKRLEAIAKSPVFSHLSDTLFGLQTIRTLRMSEDFRRRFDTYQNVHISGWFSYLTTYRWLGIRTLSVVFVYINIVIFLSVSLKDSIPGDLMGIVLLYSITYSEPIEYFVRLTAELETAMTSVERVLIYTDLEKEETQSPPLTPPENWPKQGTLSFKDVSLRHSDGAPLVLRDINFSIQHKEKIGIVGRTGAGKSSLLVALLRMAEPTGEVIIDGVTSKDIGLQGLRRKISVIPQDPVLFTGTLRTNIDPFSEYCDSDVWAVLKQVQMDEKVKNAEGQLEMETTEYGNNFSVGERQLICLARALLRKNKILVLDEATANVDNKTDALIQKTIRDQFLDSTVLTIAHRLNTVMDSDRIMVLENGQLVEIDAPISLLANRESYFSRLLNLTEEPETQCTKL